MSPLLLVLLTTAPGGAEHLRLAAPGFTPVNISPAEADFFSDHLAQALTLQGARVITNKQMAAVLGLERQKELLGCSDAQGSCLIELANALGVDGLVTGSVGKFLDSYQANINITSSRSAQPVTAIALKALTSRELLDALTGAAQTLAPEAAAKLGRKLDETLQRKTPLRAFAWLPLVAGVLLAGGGAWCLVDMGQHVSALRAPPDTNNALSYDEAVRHRDAAKLDQSLGYALFGAGGAALLAAAAMFVFGGPPEAAASVAPVAFVGGDRFGVGVSGVFP